MHWSLANITMLWSAQKYITKYFPLKTCSTCCSLYYVLRYGFLMDSIKTIMDDYIRPLMILYLACAGAFSIFRVTQFHTQKFGGRVPWFYIHCSSNQSSFRSNFSFTPNRFKLGKWTMRNQCVPCTLATHKHRLSRPCHVQLLNTLLNMLL